MARQITAKTLEEALIWIHTQPHFEAGVEQPNETHAFYRNHFQKLRVPRDAPWFADFSKSIEAQTRPHDDRMYALTPVAKRRLYASTYGLLINESEHP